MSKFALACRGRDTLLALDAERGYPRWLSTLREGVAMPSVTMRNFATEPATWYDFMAAIAKVGNGDFELEIEFETLLDGSSAYVFRGGSFGVYLYENTNKYSYYVVLDALLSGLTATYTNNCIAIGTGLVIQKTIIPSVGRYTVKIICSGLTVSVYLDDDLIYIGTGDARSALSTVIQSNFNGNILSITLISAGETLFAYPTWAEKTRLVTTNGNVDMSTGVFKQASTAARWSVDTPISLSGTPAQYTFICRCKFVTTASGFQIGFCDGVPLSGNPNTAGVSFFYQLASGNIIFGAVFLQNGTNVMPWVTAPATAYLDHMVVWSCVIDGMSGTMGLYADGQKIGQQLYPLYITGTLGTYTSLLRIGHPTAASVATVPNEVSHLAVKNYAMTQAQIAGITRTLKSPAPVLTLNHGAGTLDIDVIGNDVVRRYSDGSTSLGNGRVTKTVPAGTTTIEAFDWGIPTSTLYIRSSTALSDAVIAAKDLPRATNTLYLITLPGLTGECADLPRATISLTLDTLPGLTGECADLPRATTTLYLINLPGLTGECADLPRVTSTLYLQILPGLTGACADLPRATTTLYLINLPGLTGACADLPRVTNTLYLNTLPGLTGACVDLPRATNLLNLNNLPGLTGACADLPRATTTLQLNNLPGLTGACVDLPRATNLLHLNTLPGLTGACAALPTNTGDRRVVGCINITGALPVVSTNTPIYFYGNSSVTPEEYDQTIQNCVDAGGTGKALYISSRRTSASDANKAILISRGWTVNDSNV